MNAFGADVCDICSRTHRVGEPHACAAGCRACKGRRYLDFVLDGGATQRVPCLCVFRRTAAKEDGPWTT